ncbi:MAG: aminoacyl-tRNA hydrolase [Bilifractor sp.]|nr:aminoacyl-tRNA hydrolase [Lachnospiraceae bacterium]
MYLIAGLGNPGRKYEKTKHNVGFEVIDELIERYHVPYGGLDRKALYGKTVIGGQKCILIKPMTYMNLSGEAVRAYLDYYRMNPETDLIVIYDDIDLDPGQLRIRKKGSAGGHNGMKNIIAMTGTDAFARIRVGTGAKPENWDLADYVLAPFGKDERKAVDEAEKNAADAVELIVQGDMDRAMNLFNRKPEK